MKLEEIRQLSREELSKKVSDLQNELLSSRVAKANQQLKNLRKIRNLRREIARILTIIGEKKHEKN